MALTRRPTRIDIYDENGVGPVNVDVHYAIETDAADVVNVHGNGRVKGVVVKCECPRAAVGALLAQCQVVNDGGWPEGALPLPLPRKP